MNTIEFKRCPTCEAHLWPKGREDFLNGYIEWCVTDNILIPYSDGSYDYNRLGHYVQIIAEYVKLENPIHLSSRRQFESSFLTKDSITSKDIEDFLQKVRAEIGDGTKIKLELVTKIPSPPIRL